MKKILLRSYKIAAAMPGQPFLQVICYWRVTYIGDWRQPQKWRENVSNGTNDTGQVAYSDTAYSDSWLE